MSKPGVVDAPGVAMPMIDDQAEVVDETIPKAISPQTRSPPPKNVQEAYKRMRSTRDAGELCATLTVCCGLVCAGICMTIFLAALSLVHLYLLIVGALHLNDCPAERFIPIYLIVAGVFAILRAILNWYYAWCHPKIKKESRDAAVVQEAKPSPFSNIINLFLLVWLICGAVWVFRATVTFDDVLSSQYCDKLTYYTAYIYIIFSFVIMGITMMILFCFCYCFVCAMIVSGGASKGTSETRGHPREV